MHKDYEEEHSLWSLDLYSLTPDKYGENLLAHAYDLPNIDTDKVMQTLGINNEDPETFDYYEITTNEDVKKIQSIIPYHQIDLKSYYYALSCGLVPRLYTFDGIKRLICEENLAELKKALSAFGYYHSNKDELVASLQLIDKFQQREMRFVKDILLTHILIRDAFIPPPNLY